MEFCEESGCVGDKCFQNCKFSSDGKPVDSPLHMQDTLYLRWKQWDCHSDCLYHCMFSREEERQKLGEEPIKYHGKWPFQRIYGIQVKIYLILILLFFYYSLSSYLVSIALSPGTCICRVLCHQPLCPIPWMAVFLYPCALQFTLEVPERNCL